VATKSSKLRVPARTTQTRDAELTRGAILDAAEEEFSKNGLAGARTDAIAALTGVTKAMIYYYFENKEALYQAVLERAFADRIREAQQVVKGVENAKEALEKYLNFFLANSQHNPNISGIMVHEAMQNKGKYYKQIGMLTFYEILSDILESGIKSGDFRELDPLHTSVNIIGLCAFYFCAHENLKYLWPGKQMLSQSMIEQHKREAVQLILAGVAK
jgi:TetR/AcrR family transcriptional regulator